MNSQLVTYLLPISTNYVLGGSRFEPLNTDCSGIVCAAFYQVFGIKPNVIGTWTGAQWASNATDFVWQGETPELPYDSMEIGDLIFTSTASAMFDTVNGSHVGFYTGDVDAPFLSHFADGGPYVTAVNGVYGGHERFFGVKRWDDMNAVDVWAYKNEEMNGNRDAYQLLSDIHKSCFGADDEAVSTLYYRNRKMNGEKDVYQLLTDMANGIEKLLEKFE